MNLPIHLSVLPVSHTVIPLVLAAQSESAEQSSVFAGGGAVKQRHSDVCMKSNRT